MDDYSSYAYCYLLRSKSEATSAITTFLELIKNQHTKVIKKFRSDHGGGNLITIRLINYLLQKE
jgi:hypothetical protein